MHLSAPGNCLGVCLEGSYVVGSQLGEEISVTALLWLDFFLRSNLLIQFPPIEVIKQVVFE